MWIHGRNVWWCASSSPYGCKLSLADGNVCEGNWKTARVLYIFLALYTWKTGATRNGRGLRMCGTRRAELMRIQWQEQRRRIFDIVLKVLADWLTVSIRDSVRWTSLCFCSRGLNLWGCKMRYKSKIIIISWYYNLIVIFSEIYPHIPSLKAFL